MKYKIILIDCPWAYNRTGGQACVTKYKRMSDKDIYNLPINDIAADDCALLCWMTFPKLSEGIKAIESWGFIIKTVFVTWIKLNPNNGKPFFGVGSYTKSNAEVCMLCSKGSTANLLPPRKSQVGPDYIGKLRNDSMSSVLLYPRTEHSAKPPIVRTMIQDMFIDCPKIEIFARQRVDGWDSIGYGVDSMDISQSLELIKNDQYDAKNYIQPTDDI